MHTCTYKVHSYGQLTFASTILNQCFSRFVPNILEILPEITGDDIFTSNFCIGKPDAVQQTLVGCSCFFSELSLLLMLVSLHCWSRCQAVGLESHMYQQAPLQVPTVVRISLVEKHCSNIQL